MLFPLVSAKLIRQRGSLLNVQTNVRPKACNSPRKVILISSVRAALVLIQSRNLHINQYSDTVGLYVALVNHKFLKTYDVFVFYPLITKKIVR